MKERPEGLVQKLKLKGRLGCNGHEMIKILGAAGRSHNKLAAWDFWRADFGLLRDLLDKVPWDVKPWREEDPKEVHWYSKITFSKLRSNASWQKETSEKNARSSWTNINTKKKLQRVEAGAGAQEKYG